jgi:hypothetical protein
MKNIRDRGLSLLFGLFAFCIFAVIYKDNFFQNYGLIATSLLFSISVVNLVLQPHLKLNQDRDAGDLGALGVRWYFAVLALSLAFPAPICVATNYNVAAAILSFLAIGFMILSKIISSFTKEIVTEIDSRINFSSAHLNWSDQLAILANQMPVGDTQQKISQLSSDLKYASRSNPASAGDVERRIDLAITELKNSAIGDHSALDQKIAAVQSLLKERDVELRAFRRKA